ncbi:hypothetical protein ARHIZOSPH14_26020 [Agromyces rhizosphaerae]|uniref:Uncharacterized protein n=1 Tax=Agromyces rhizosphaerae TaxID=88374 RepID=A0A9W6CXX7_9MICO|nr:hypothetical protein [Agromyces rhizosphaerae]GLI28360.1 hypothetical protein ARHIZOSPH14_26020 [Agromyces rhizosphaerae]
MDYGSSAQHPEQGASEVDSGHSRPPRGLLSVVLASIAALGLVVGLIAYLALVAAVALIPITGVQTLGSSAQWGTYHERDCATVGRGCVSIGQWRGDDGTFIETVQLAGRTYPPDGVRAAYTPDRWYWPWGEHRVVVQTEHSAWSSIVFGTLGTLLLIAVPAGVVVAVVRFSAKSVPEPGAGQAASAS